MNPERTKIPKEQVEKVLKILNDELQYAQKSSEEMNGVSETMKAYYDGKVHDTQFAIGIIKIYLDK